MERSFRFLRETLLTVVWLNVSLLFLCVVLCYKLRIYIGNKYSCFLLSLQKSSIFIEIILLTTKDIFKHKSLVTIEVAKNEEFFIISLPKITHLLKLM